MSDAEDTRVVPTTLEVTQVTQVTVPPDDVRELPENVSTNDSPEEKGNSSSENIESIANASGQNEATASFSKNGGEGRTEHNEDEKLPTTKSNKTDAKKIQPCPPPRSRCRTRSRDTRQCKKHFREMIGKHEIRNDELEQHETDLRQRLEMLECSMPAVMVWNIWRMAQGAPVSHLRDIVEKQFLGPATGFSACPSTPSQHWDCRVREVEAERKQAKHRAEEARQVFAVKGDALKFQKQQIEEARKLQAERKAQVAKLEEEVKRLQDALKKAQGDENSCETGECGEIQCRKMWLQDAASVSSIHSTDLECLARVQDLAEAELCMKRQIADLERRECAYMRTLQQADEMWAKMENDNASNMDDLKEQLDAKIIANQKLADRIVELEDEIEKLRAQVTKASTALDEYTGKTFVDVGLGDVNVSTEEKTEQTEDAKEIPDHAVKIPDIQLESENKDIQPMETDVTGIENIGQSHQTQPNDQSVKSETPIDEVAGEKKEDPTITPLQSNDEQIQAKVEIDTTEDGVQANPDYEDAETQSVTKKLGKEKKSGTEEPTRVETSANTEVVDGERIADVIETSSNVPKKQSAEQLLGLAAAPNKSREFENKGSLSHPPEVSAKDESTEASLRVKTDDKSTDQKESLEAVTRAVDQEIVRTDARQANEEAVEAAVKTTPRMDEELAVKTTPEVPKPVANAITEPVSEPRTKADGVTSSKPALDAPSEPITQDNAVTSPEIPTKSIPDIINEETPKVFPIPTTEASLRPTIEPVLPASNDVVPTPLPHPSVTATNEPVFESELPQVVDRAKFELPANTSAVPIQTLQDWHIVVTCVQRQISICSSCSPANADVCRVLDEIRTHLGENAPDPAEIKCAKLGEDVKNSITLPNKKGPCICKPKTCPLDGTTATISPPQASVQMQTIVDGQSQTPMSVKTSSREPRGLGSTKGSIRSKEEVKLTSIEEGTEPDHGMQRTKLIPRAKDESTVTVGDIASQTETIRKPIFANKTDEKPCVCPTGVCPKKNAKPPTKECAPAKARDVTKKPTAKEYKSTADAILAPAITVLSSNECTSTELLSNVKTEGMNASSSSFACCVCGKPVTPVPSKKITSIPRPTKSLSKNKVMLTSEKSEDDFLCCTCKVKSSSSGRMKSISPSNSRDKSAVATRVSHRGKPVVEAIKTSCSREVCCSCNTQEMHDLPKTSSTYSEVSKSKVKRETKDVCCLAKISRDKSSKAGARRRKDQDSIRTATPSVAQSVSGQSSSSSSAYAGSRISDSSDSNVCCSSIEQVVGMMKKKGKGMKCACDGKDGESNKGECVCGDDIELMDPKKGKHIERSDSCVCPPKLFDKI